MNSISSRRSALRTASLAVAVISITTMTLAGCSTAASPAKSSASAGSFDKLVKAAQKEGSVTLVGQQGEDRLAAIATNFKDKYGITVNYQRLATAQQEQVVDQQIKSGQVQVDVSYLADEYWVDGHAKNGDWLNVQNTKVMPALTKLPAKLRKKYDVPVSLSTLGFIYNTKDVKKSDLPKTPADLADPRWKNKLGIVDPVVVGRPALGSLLEWQKKYGSKFQSVLNGIFAQNPKVFASAAEGIQLVASGEIDGLDLGSPTFVGPLKDQGAPVGISYLTPSASYTRTVQIPAKAPHPNAAKLLANWMLSPAGQDIVCGNGDSTSPYGGTQTGLVMPKDVIAPNQQEIVDKTDELVKAYNTAKG